MLHREKDYLNYDAKLANENQLDKAFLSLDIQCSIVELSKLTDIAERPYGEDFVSREE